MVDFSAAASSDDDGSIVSYAWDFGDGNVDSGVSASHVFEAEGSYTTKVTVTDNEGATASATTSISVSAPGIPANIPPVAEISSSAMADTPFGVQFDAGKSSDDDGSIVSYAWDFGDGTTASGKNSDHLYTGYGNYVVTLEVTDNGGATAQDEAVITLVDPNRTFYGINFQPADVQAPEGFLPDSGQDYDPARGYGWTTFV